MYRTNVKEVLDALDDVAFPADRDRLVHAAEEAGASGDVVAALRHMPNEEYGSRTDVAHSVDVDPASDLGLSDAQRAEQARLGGKRGLSQHLRDVPKPPLQEELGKERRREF